MMTGIRLSLRQAVCGFIVILMAAGSAAAAGSGWNGPGGAGDEGSLFAQRMAPGTRAESLYKFTVSELYASPPSKQSGFLKFENSWSDLPDTLVPGQPFNMKLEVNMLQRQIPSPDKFLSIGELRWTTGVMVTAGKEWVTKTLTQGDPIRIEGGMYRIPDPSPQLMLTKEVSAGYLVSETDGSSSIRWINSATTTFNEPVPDKIPDKNTFAAPKENIKDEMMLVIIYATGLTSRIYLDSNYLYIYTKDSSGRAVWKLRTQFSTSNFKYDDTVNEGSCIIDLKQ